MNFRGNTRKRREVGINISPLVDVVFLLVIFFAVTTTFLDTAGLELELPEASSRAERAPESLTVFIDQSGRISFEDRLWDSPEALEPRLRELLADRDDKTVVVRGDTAVDYGIVVDLMDAVRAAGAEGLNLAAQAEPPPR